jgi:hypothetical protein
VIDQRTGFHRIAAPVDDEGHHSGETVGVDASDHGRLGDCRVAQKHLLDLARRHSLAAHLGDDDGPEGFDIKYLD